MSIVGMRTFFQGRLQYIMYALAIIFAVGFIGLAMGGGGDYGDDSGGGEGGVIAEVNGEKIDGRAFDIEFGNSLLEMEQQQNRRLNAFEEGMYRGSVFQQKVDAVLRVQAAKKAGLKASKREVRDKIDEIIDGQMDMYKNQLLADKKGEKTDKAFEAALKKATGMSISQMENEIRSNLDEDAVRQQLINEKLEAMWKSEVDSSEKAIRASYDRATISQITIGTQGRSDEQAKKLADEIVSKLRKGEDFTALAKKHSDDPYKEQGGKRPSPIMRQDYQQELADAVFGLKPGEISNPIKTQMGGGYVIAKLEGIKNELPADYAKKKEDYKKQYVQMAEYRIMMEKPEELRENAKIVISDPELKAFVMMRDSWQLPPDQQKAKAMEAVKYYRQAAEEAGGGAQASARAYAQIAYIYNRYAQKDQPGISEEERIKYRDEAEKALNEALVYTESSDLEMMLANIHIEKGEYAKALERLDMAVANAGDQANMHSMIMAKLDEIKGKEGVDDAKVAELLEQERVWMADYQKRMAEQQAQMNQQTAPPPAPKETKTDEPADDKAKSGG